MITFKYYSKEFIVENKLNDPGLLLILDTIFNWIFGKNPPEIKIINNELYFYLSQQYLTKFLDSVMNFVTVNRKFNLLKKAGLIKNQFVETKTRKSFYCFNWSIVEKCLASENELNENNFKNNWLSIIKNYKKCIIDSYNYNKETNMNESLFEFEDVKKVIESEKKPKYSEKSYELVCNLIHKANEFGIFNHRIYPYGDSKQTKLFNESCKYVQMIYDGNFFSPRMYPFSEKYLNNKQFPINLAKSKEKVLSVKKDWCKVEELLLQALNNFKLMFNKDRVPCDKGYLVKGLNVWFYAMSNQEAGKYQSQFLQSLFEPDYTSKFYSENKADNIFGQLDSKSQKYGEEIIDLSPNMSSGKAWENMRSMTNWARLVMNNEPNCGYWISSPSEILKKFCEFMKKANVIPSINTLDVSYRPESGKEPPFVWFLKDAIKIHKLNPNLINCSTEEDFSKYYKESIF